MGVRGVLDAIAKPLGLRVVRKHAMDLFYRHDYGEGGYDRYREVQIATNRRKFEQVFTDQATLEHVAADIAERCPDGPGICHGARNGWEVAKLRELTRREVVGTDISETAVDVPNMSVWDFNQANPDWVGKFAFVYSNSHDQAFDMWATIGVWAEQLKPGGMIYLEHTNGHTAAGSGEMDPNGVHPLFLPYMALQQGGDRYLVTRVRELDVVRGGKSRHVWIFVVQPNR